MNSRRSVTAIVALVAAVVLLTLVETRWTPLRRVDLDVAADLNAWATRHDTTTTALKWVSEVGQPASFHVLAVISALLLWRRGQVRRGLFVVVVVVGASLLSTLTKLLVGRSRPDVDVPLIHPASSSFPSGHALASFAACGVAVLTITSHRALVVAAATVVAAAVGFSRLALGAHYLSDVLGAWAIAIVWLCTTATVILTDRPRTPVPRAGWHRRAGTRPPTG